MFTAPRRFGNGDDLSKFTCGESAIDSWLQKHTCHAFRCGTAVIYVTFDGESGLAGFYRLSPYELFS